jgi:hypothetical protein
MEPSFRTYTWRDVVHTFFTERRGLKKLDSLRLQAYRHIYGLFSVNHSKTPAYVELAWDCDSEKIRNPCKGRALTN